MMGWCRFRRGSSRLVATLLLAAACLVAGCGERRRPAARRSASPEPQAAAAPARQAMTPEMRSRLLDGAMDVLGNLESYEEPLAFAQVFDRLNQWSHAVGDVGADDASDGANAWRRDPLVDSLPERLRGGGVLRGLDTMAFDASDDLPALRDQRWLADVAATARGDALDDLDVAKAMFAWTVRSLAISSDPPMVPTESNPGTRWFAPGEILIAGRASAPQRGWIFLELLRHAGLEGVMLATGDADAGTLRPWIPALISGGEAYLFDPAYGIAVPGPGGKGVATAREAAADPAILQALSLPDRQYPVQAPDMARLSVLVAVTPLNLARRMHHLERQLAGTRRVDLAIDATAIAGRAVAALPGGDGGGRRQALWEFPWETIQRRGSPATVAALAKELRVMSLAMTQPTADRSTRSFRPLYAGRLREFRGLFDGPDGAKMAYLSARPGAGMIADALRGAPPEQAEVLRGAYDEMKADATYRLGVVTLAEKEYEAAVDYLGRMTLEANPEGVWADAARVNLAVAKLGLGERDEAVRLLREDPSPQRFGSRILAEGLAAGER